jgi:hypothetical protein
MIEIVELNESLLDDFIELLKCRGGGNSEIEKMVYGESKYYSGFIAYVDKVPAGCIGFVKRNLNLDELINITWFNDWFVKDCFRGLNIGKLLIQKVANYTGTSCGMISPKTSRLIGQKAGFDNDSFVFECRFPLNPIQIGYKKYFYDSKYHDSIIKRFVRTFIFKITSSYRLDFLQKCNYTSGPIKIKDEAIESRFDLLKQKPEFLKFVLGILEAQKNNKLEYWTIHQDNFWSCGFQFTTKNGICESLVLYVSNLNSHNAYSIYSNIIACVKENTKSDQINILLNGDLKNKFKINNLFYNKLAFFTFQMPAPPDKFIQHIDKDSSWRF